MPRKVTGLTISEAIKRYKQLKEASATIVATEAINHFKSSFNNQGFTNDALVPWKPRKDGSDKGRAIGTKTARLKRSIKLITKTDRLVRIGVDLNEVPYAKVFNDGIDEEVTVKAHRRKIQHRNLYSIKNKKISAHGVGFVRQHKRKAKQVARPFMGQSSALTKKINDKINREARRLGLAK